LFKLCQHFWLFVSGRELLDDTDSRVAYYSSAFLLKARCCHSSTRKLELFFSLLLVEFC
jgi:hypothetical protein